jgi:two-component system, OmpR family, sensor histidine kinase PhoQ
VLAFVLRAVLRPLGRIETEIRAMESGRSEQLSASYPEELRGVATNLNALLRRERSRQQRYRESLANLAHSLKTPLAAIRTLLASPLEPEADRLAEIDRELARMDRIIGWQLRRAAAAGAGGVGLVPVAVAPVARDLATTLDKVYLHRQIHCELEIPDTARFRGAEGDLQEILGNLMDNAWKYAQSRVRCSATASEAAGLELRVEDDGEGLDPASAALVLARGTRLDESQPGQGIGLAVVKELAESYGGSVAVEASELGGAALIVRLPGHPASAAFTIPGR